MRMRTNDAKAFSQKEKNVSPTCFRRCANWKLSAATGQNSIMSGIACLWCRNTLATAQRIQTNAWFGFFVHIDARICVERTCEAYWFFQFSPLHIGHAASQQSRRGAYRVRVFWMDSKATRRLLRGNQACKDANCSRSRRTRAAQGNQARALRLLLPHLRRLQFAPQLHPVPHRLHRL